MSLLILLTCLVPPSETTPRPGIVFVVGGVGGIDPLGWGSRWSLPRAGVPHEIREFVWTHGRGRVLQDLQDHAHLLLMADQLAAEARRLRESEPDRPIYFLAKSGGTGLVLAAAERLPPDTLERIVLLSAAVSPSYDLRPALRATRGEILAFISPNDRLVLGWGTSRFGTVDRVYGPSAGLTGFLPPRELDEEGRRLHARLIQIPWHPYMLRYGFGGAHVGDSFPAFLRQFVAPWLQPYGLGIPVRN